jgi:plastocyanin
MALGALTACGGGGGDGGTTPTPIPTTLTLTPTSPDTLFSKGQTVQLTATVLDQNNRPMTSAVTFSSSDAAVASVGATTGLVTAVGAGPASVFIRAQAASLKDSVKVSVRQRLDHVTVSPASVTLAPGATRQLAVTPMDARNNAITGLGAPSFGSDNTAVADVSTTGVVTANTVGTAHVTASVTSPADGTKSATATITVATQQTTNADVTASASSNAFIPASVTISANGTVTWHFGARTHNVTFDTQGAPADIGNSQNVDVARTFSTAGTFNYHCSLHSNMTGQVIVQP